MNPNSHAEAIIQQHLDAVAAALGGATPAHRESVLRELREHIQEELHRRAAGRSATTQDAHAVLATMDPPGSYTEAERSEGQVPTLDQKLILLSVICSVLQVVGLAAVITHVPVVPAMAGFAAIVNFFLNWSKKPETGRALLASAVPALCGLFLILIELGRAL